MSRARCPFRRGAVAAAVLAVMAMAPAAWAGQTCEVRPPNPDTIARSMTLALRTAQWLDASGAQVVVLARRGQNLDRWGVRWSHLGYAYRDDMAQAWRIVHKLNICGTAQAALYRQGLAPFFSDDLYAYEAAVVVPTPALQAALRPLLQDNAQAATLHQRAYSMVAYPWAQAYQQSNQWALETLALALEPTTTDRARAQAWLRFKGYQPTLLSVGAGERLGARLTRANVAFDDHPGTDRFAGRIATVTVDSVFTFLQSNGWAGPTVVLR